MSDSQTWCGAVPTTADGLKFCRELWEYYNTADAVAGLRSSMGVQLDVLRLGGEIRNNGKSSYSGPDGAQLDAIARHRKTWAKLCLLRGSTQETLSRYYGGRKVSEHQIAAAHKAFYGAGK